jgi:delta 1-pyrroline-5-carboxylate dehydrogenase
VVSNFKRGKRLPGRSADKCGARVARVLCVRQLAVNFEILVWDAVYDAFMKRLAETAGAMKVADGFEPGAAIGPLIDMKAVEKVEAYIADAVKKGAKVVMGGKRAAQGSSFFEPTMLTDVTTDMVITKEEAFGPVAPLYRLRTDAEAVKMANGGGLPGSGEPGRSESGPHCDRCIEKATKPARW